MLVMSAVFCDVDIATGLIIMNRASISFSGGYLGLHMSGDVGKRLLESTRALVNEVLYSEG